MTSRQVPAVKRPPLRTTSRRCVFALVAGAFILASCARSPVSETTQMTFPTPDAAAQALAKAVSANDTAALVAIMGPESRPMIMATDQVQATRDRQVVAAAMAEQWWLEENADSSRTLVIGNEAWPFPIPIVGEKGVWRFDTAAGKEELLHRRIGGNETAVMEVATTYVQAQREYASRSRDGNPKGTYAQRFVSEPGKHDGLFWPVSSSDSAMSPMGELAAKAAADGYTRSDTGRTAYHGYYFKVLTSQGSSAPGGARSYVVNGAMRGGFALLAWPADYGESGIMTFIVGPDGVIRERDLGPDTRTLAPAINAFNPDSSWQRSTTEPR